MDCSDYDAVKRTVDSVVATHGRIDVFINNAGLGRWRSLVEMPPEEVTLALSAPFMASIWCSKAVLPHFLKANAGTIVNVQSPASVSAISGATVYSTARWGLRGLTASLRADLFATNVCVCEVILNHTFSEYWTNNPGSASRMPAIGALLRPKLSPEDAGRAVVSAIRSGRATSTYPFMLSSLVALHPLMPGTVDWMAQATGWKMPVGADTPTESKD